MRKLLSVCLCVCLAVTALAGCGKAVAPGGAGEVATSGEAAGPASVEATSAEQTTTTEATTMEAATAAPEPEAATAAAEPETTTVEPTEAATEAATATVVEATTTEKQIKETGPDWGEGEGEGGIAGESDSGASALFAKILDQALAGSGEVADTGAGAGTDAGADVGVGAGTDAGAEADAGAVAGHGASAGNTAKPAFANPGNVDFSDAELPPEAVVFPDAQWNDMGYFLARAIGYVEMQPDPSKLPNNWPEELKVFGVFFQVQGLEMIKETTTIDSNEFAFGGPGVQRVSLNVKPAGNTKSTYFLKEIGQIGYVNTCMAAEKLEDITMGWYSYSIKNVETDLYDKYIEYLISLPFGNLIVNDRPDGFDYDIPPSAVACVGDWSDPGADPTIKLRMLAYQEYPLLERELPDFMRLDDHLYLLYFEVENTGAEKIHTDCLFLTYSGRGVSKVSFFSLLKFTTYDSTLFLDLEPGKKLCFYNVICIGSMSDLQAISLKNKPNNIDIPLAF